MNQRSVERAVEAHTNLNIFAAVQALMESGLLYGPSIAAASQIIAICKKEQARQLLKYDKAIAAAKEPSHG